MPSSATTGVDIAEIVMAVIGILLLLVFRYTEGQDRAGKLITVYFVIVTVPYCHTTGGRGTLQTLIDTIPEIVTSCVAFLFVQGHFSRRNNVPAGLFPGILVFLTVAMAMAFRITVTHRELTAVIAGMTALALTSAVGVDIFQSVGRPELLATAIVAAFHAVASVKVWIAAPVLVGTASLGFVRPEAFRNYRRSDVVASSFLATLLAFLTDRHRSHVVAAEIERYYRTDMSAILSGAVVAGGVMMWARADRPSDLSPTGLAVILSGMVRATRADVLTQLYVMALYTITVVNYMQLGFRRCSVRELVGILNWRPGIAAAEIVTQYLPTAVVNLFDAPLRQASRDVFVALLNTAVAVRAVPTFAALRFVGFAVVVWFYTGIVGILSVPNQVLTVAAQALVLGTQYSAVLPWASRNRWGGVMSSRLLHIVIGTNLALTAKAMTNWVDPADNLGFACLVVAVVGSAGSLADTSINGWEAAAPHVKWPCVVLVAACVLLVSLDYTAAGSCDATPAPSTATGRGLTLWMLDFLASIYGSDSSSGGNDRGRTGSPGLKELIVAIEQLRANNTDGISSRRFLIHEALIEDAKVATMAGLYVASCVAESLLLMLDNLRTALVWLRTFVIYRMTA